jgi:hypothetical protein
MMQKGVGSHCVRIASTKTKGRQTNCRSSSQCQVRDVFNRHNRDMLAGIDRRMRQLASSSQGG